MTSIVQYFLGAVMMMALSFLAFAILFGASELSLYIFVLIKGYFLYVLASAGSLVLILFLLKKQQFLFDWILPAFVFLFFAILCIYSTAVAYFYGGVLLVVLGLIFWGVGIIPIAFVTALLNADWTMLGWLTLLVIAIVACLVLLPDPDELEDGLESAESEDSEETN